jgi:hypothetical protein
MIYTEYHFFPLICTIDTNLGIVKKDRGLRAKKCGYFTTLVWSGYGGGVAKWGQTV